MALKIILNSALVSNTEKLELNENLKQQNKLDFGNAEMYFSEYEKTENIINPTTKNNFLNAFLAAYNHHLLIKIRPDDIHIMIELIISTCMSNNVEALRDIFVAHKDKKQLTVESEVFDINLITSLFKESIKNEIKDPKFADKMICQYTTTNHITQTVSNTLLMNAMKEYFSSTMVLACGIPIRLNV